MTAYSSLLSGALGVLLTTLWFTAQAADPDTVGTGEAAPPIAGEAIIEFQDLDSDITFTFHHGGKITWSGPWEPDEAARVFLAFVEKVWPEVCEPEKESSP